MRFASLAILCVLTSAAACPPIEEPEDLGCGEAPGAFDPEGDVVYAASDEGCVRLERRTLDDGSIAPVRLIAHVEGFTQRFDVDTDALTYEGRPGGTAIVTSDDVTVTLAIDVCTGEWTVEVNEGEAILPVVG